jgi:hypothetical protein
MATTIGLNTTANLSFFLALPFVPTQCADGGDARSAPTTPLFSLDRLPNPDPASDFENSFSYYLLVTKQEQRRIKHTGKISLCDSNLSL